MDGATINNTTTMVEQMANQQRQMMKHMSKQQVTLMDTLR